MENSSNVKRKSRSPIVLIASIVGAILFTVVGIFLLAFVILPNLVSTDSIKSIVESKLNQAISNNSQPKNSIAGAPTSVINPYLQVLKDQARTYQWKTGEVHAYEFSFLVGNDQKSNFKVQGDCQYTIGNEKVVLNNRSGEGVGTAFVIAAGYLATSYRAVQIAERITFVGPDKRYAAKIVDIDKVNDIAILAYEGEGAPVVLADTASLETAESVVLLGFPQSDDPAVGIKSTVGKVASIDATKGGQVIAIEGASNPGNPNSRNQGTNGGPVLNSKGQVVGLAGASSQGENPSLIAFASRVEGLHVLMNKNSIAVKGTVADGPLDVDEMVSSVSPSVGRLELSNWVDNRCLDISFLAKYSGTIQSPVVIYNGVRKEGLSGQMVISRLGEVRSISEIEPLPFVLASIPELLFQPFDLAASDKWTSFRNYEIDASPRSGLGRMRSRFGDFMGRGERQPGTPAVLKCDFEVISSNQDMVRFKKTRFFQMQADKSQPALEVKGEGVWEFDTKQGLPISVEENLTVFNVVNGKSTETPLSYKVTRVDPTLVQERVRLAQEQAEKQKKEQDIEQTQPNPALIDELVSQLGSKEAEPRFSAMSRLARIAIVEDKRESTLKALRSVIAGKDSIMHGLGWTAYMHWMNAACAPELRRIISKSPVHRKAALNALLELKQEEDLPLMLENLSGLSYDAKKSLSSFGSKMESLVFERLLAEKDTFAQIELLDLLDDVGTDQSIAKLTELSSKGDLGFKIRAESTIMAIKIRLERNKK